MQSRRDSGWWGLIKLGVKMTRRLMMAGTWWGRYPKGWHQLMVESRWTPRMTKQTWCKRVHRVDEKRRRRRSCPEARTSSASSEDVRRRRCTELENAIEFQGSTMVNTKWLAMVHPQLRRFTNHVRSASHKGTGRQRIPAKKTTTAPPTPARRWRNQVKRADRPTLSKEKRWENGHADAVWEVEVRGEVSDLLVQETCGQGSGRVRKERDGSENWAALNDFNEEQCMSVCKGSAWLQWVWHGTWCMLISFPQPLGSGETGDGLANSGESRQWRFHLIWTRRKASRGHCKLLIQTFKGLWKGRRFSPGCKELKQPGSQKHQQVCSVGRQCCSDKNLCHQSLRSARRFRRGSGGRLGWLWEDEVLEIFRVDAKAEGDYIVVGGWGVPESNSAFDARWFSVVLNRKNAPWAYLKGEPFRNIASLELVAVLVAAILFGDRVAKHTHVRGERWQLARTTWGTPLSLIILWVANIHCRLWWWNLQRNWQCLASRWTWDGYRGVKTQRLIRWRTQSSKVSIRTNAPWWTLRIWSL